MSDRELFRAALERDDPRARAEFLDRACEGDAALRARVEALLKAREETGDDPEEPADGPDASIAPPDPDTTAKASGRPHEPTDAGSEATGACVPRSTSDAMPHPAQATGDWTPEPPDPDATIDGDTASRDLPRGTVVRYFGDYEIQKELGRGGMGVVYRARQVSLNRPVALKMIKAGVLADDAELQRFQNEAEAVALLDHPGIVPVYEVGEHDAQRYFSMKLVEGENLAERIAAQKADPKGSATLLGEIAEAVHHAHMRGILHRDLKPANILVDTEGHPHVTDFGLAKRVEGDVEMTASGAILGTPAFMSPEQARGRRGSITTATDVYGLGAIFYAMLTGKAPFGGSSVIETLDAVRTRPPDPPRKINVHVPRDLETICLKCLDKDPRRRYASAHELAEDLRNWLESRPIRARRVGPTERAWLWCKRRPAVASLAAAVLLAIFAGTIVVFVVQSLANARLEAANTKLQRSNEALEKEQARVKVREAQAVEAIKRFGDSVANEPVLKNSPALNDLRRRLLGEPIAFFKSLRDQLQADAGTRPESLESLASAAYQNANLSHTIGDREDARKSFIEGIALLERLARDHPSETKYRDKLAGSYYGMAIVQSAVGKLQEARASADRASSIYADLLVREPGQPDHRRGMARCHLMLGLLEYQTSHPLPALDWLRKARDEFQELLPGSADPSGIRAELVMCFIDLGGVEEILKRWAEALTDYNEGLSIVDRLVRDNPHVASYQDNQAKLHGNIGKVLSLSGKRAEAEAPFEKSRLIYESLAAQYPSTIDYQKGLAGAYLSLGQVASYTGRPGVAESWGIKARAVFERLAAEHPESPDLASEVGAVIHNLGTIKLDSRQFAEAREILLEAMVWQRKALKANPSNPRYLQCVRSHLTNLVEAATALGDQETLAKAREELARADAADPRKVALDRRLADLAKGATPSDNAERLALADRAYQTKDFAIATRLWTEAFATDPKLAGNRQLQLPYNAACAAALSGCGQGKEDPPLDDPAKAKLREQARAWLEAELAVWTKFVESGPPQAKAFIAQTLQHWREDTDLAGVRESKALEALPEAERDPWRALWAGVDALLARAQAAPAPAGAK